MSEVVCAHCKKEPKSYFEITRHRDGEKAPGVVRACSILCLIQWAYSYGVSLGVSGAFKASEILSDLKSLLKAVKT